MVLDVWIDDPKFCFVKLNPFPFFVSVFDMIIRSTNSVRSFSTIWSTDKRPNEVSINKGNR